MKTTYPTHYTNKQIWLIAYPILISLIMEQMIGMTDTAFLGRVGEIELGASAIAGVFYTVIFMVAFGFSIGTQILIARRNGEANYKPSVRSSTRASISRPSWQPSCSCSPTASRPSC